jgi:hypothetical protein
VSQIARSVLRPARLASPRPPLPCTSQATMAFFARPQSASAAVKIVAPSAVLGDPTKTSPKKGNLPFISFLFCPHRFVDSTQRQCRNILIYGCVSDPSLATVSIHRRVVHVNFKIKAVSILILR